MQVPLALYLGQAVVTAGIGFILFRLARQHARLLRVAREQREMIEDRNKRLQENAVELVMLNHVVYSLGYKVSKNGRVIRVEPDEEPRFVVEDEDADVGVER